MNFDKPDSINWGEKEDMPEQRSGDEKYKVIFTNSNMPMWEEDFSEVINELDRLRGSGITDMETHLRAHLEILEVLIRKIKIVDVNSATVKLFGAKDKEDFFSRLETIFNPEASEDFIEEFVALSYGRKSCELESVGRRITGEKFHVLLNITFPPDISVDQTVFVWMVDITERKMRETERERLLLEAWEQRLIAESLRDLSLALTSILDFDMILDKILEQTYRLIPFTSANIQLLENDTLISKRSSGYGAYGLTNFVRNTRLDVNKFPINKKVIVSNKPLIIEDTSKELEWIKFPNMAYIRSFLAVPISFRDNVLGILSVDSDKPGFFSPDDAEKLIPIAQAAAVALEHSRLFYKANEEILERKETEEMLKKSLAEKEILLREIHHRVKNNLTIINGLINLSSKDIMDPKTLQVFEQLAQRIHTMALVHESIYESKDLGRITFHDYVIELVKAMRFISTYTDTLDVDININPEISFTLDEMISLGIIVNELITNALKYGISGSGKERLSITVHHNTPENYTLEVRDSGCGFPEENLPFKKTGLGLNLVSSLTEQLRGAAFFYNDEGAVVQIKIPIRQT